MKPNMLRRFRLRHPLRAAFLIGLGTLLLLAVLWLVTHTARENWIALGNWWRVMNGIPMEDMRTPDFLQGALMLASIGWIGISVALLLSMRWWYFESEKVSRPHCDVRFVIGMGLILLMALLIRWPRMELSMYNDEIDVFRTSIEGEYRRHAYHEFESERLPRFKPVAWRETAWGNRIGNNHALNSILARSLYDPWRSIVDTPDGSIHEWPLRLPALIGGLVSIAVAGALAVVVTGSSRAGLFAAFILAIHPWHVRYSTEARGYGLLFAFAALSVLFLVLAIRDRQWRWWLAFAACQFACLWAYLGSLYLVIGFNLVAMGAILGKAVFGRERIGLPESPDLKGWIVANALTAVLSLLFLSPHLAPLRIALATNATLGHGPEKNWWIDVLAYLSLGMPWMDGDAENPFNPAVSKYLASPLVLVALVLSALLTLSGIWVLCRRHDTPGRLLVAVCFLGLILPFLACALGGGTLLLWYVCYTVVFIAVLMAAGLNAWIFGSERREGAEPGESRVIWQRLATYGLLGLYAAGVARPLVLYRKTSKQALRPAVELIRGDSFPFDDPERQLKPIVIGWWTHANFYDPYLRIVPLPESLEQVVRKARREERPLYYVLGMRSAARAEQPDTVDRLERSGEFETFRILPGLETSLFRTYVYRLKNGAEGPGDP